MNDSLIANLRAMVKSLLDENSEIIKIALRKNPTGDIIGIRGFEGWLSYELALILKEKGFEVLVEQKLKKQEKYIYSDISVVNNKNLMHLELGILDGTDRTTIKKYIEKYSNITTKDSIVLVMLYFGIYKENKYHEGFLTQYGYREEHDGDLCGTKYWLLVKEMETQNLTETSSEISLQNMNY